MASAHPSTSSGRTKRAASPATSRSAGMSAHTTAVPCAIASTTGMPNPSCRLGNANRSAPAKSANRCSRPTGPSRRTRSPSACATAAVTVVGLPSRWPGQHESVRHRVGVEPRERVEQHPHVLAGLEGSGPEHVRPVVDRVGPACTFDVGVGWRARRSTPLGTTRIRSRGIGVCVAISSALNSDTAITRRARSRRGGEALTVERDPPAGERLRHHERRGVVHGDDERHAAGRRDGRATARARGRPARPAGRGRRRRARARRRRARPRAVGGSPASRRRGRARAGPGRHRHAGWRAVNAVTSTPRPGQ